MTPRTAKSQPTFQPRHARTPYGGKVTVLGGNDVSAVVSDSDGVTTARLAGEIDTYTVAELRRSFDAIEVGPGGAVVVDLREVTFLDSSGIGALIGLHQRVESARGRLQLLCTGMPLQLLRLMGLDQVIDVVDTGD
ncbi:hypothetical protein GCM10009817_09060 [Terrabacter lapilli]|uniref:Anti-sigma factor antagonist n=1 Tax=Terrabacter lapilli TaxID=436231 RepID=A0ABP5CYY3_9MICO